MADSWGCSALALWGALLAGCVSVDEIQTPNGDLGFDGAGAGGTSAAPPEADQEGQCGAGGWSMLRVAGREQVMDWAEPSLVPGCSGAPHRLSALAPRLGANLLVLLAANTGRVVDASYSTTAVGADGEDWGDFEAFVELASLSFATATTATEQPFDLAGTIWGPFGPVSLVASGCARVRVSPC